MILLMVNRKEERETALKKLLVKTIRLQEEKLRNTGMEITLVSLNLPIVFIIR